MDITLYYCAKTRATRVRWLLEELQIPYKLKNIDIFSNAGQNKEYQAIHPYGQVPAIDIDGEVLFESGAICSVLADRFSDNKLAPQLNTHLRAKYEQWMFFAPATLEPPVFHYLLHSSIYPETQQIPEVAQWNLKNYRIVLITLEKLFKKQMKNKQFLVGNAFSCADIMIGSVLFWTPKIIVKYPLLHQYTENLRSRGAYQAALQET